MGTLTFEVIKMSDKKVDKKRKNNGGEPTTTAPDPTVPNRAHTEMKSEGAPSPKDNKKTDARGNQPI